MDTKVEVTYRNAIIEDLEFLVESRLDFINISNTDSKYEFIRSNIRQYSEKGLKENQFGKNAYITSMFVNENYRRQGIAGYWRECRDWIWNK